MASSYELSAGYQQDAFNATVREQREAEKRRVLPYLYTSLGAYYLIIPRSSLLEPGPLRRHALASARRAHRGLVTASWPPTRPASA